MMDQAQWRNYRGYIILQERSRFLGRARFVVRLDDQRLASFDNGIAAELYVDQLHGASS